MLFRSPVIWEATVQDMQLETDLPDQLLAPEEPDATSGLDR